MALGANKSSDDAGRTEAPPRPWRRLTRSLSARLLVLTIIFVMIGEIMIYAPSIASFRIDYLQERVQAARIASLAIETLPNESITEQLRRQLLLQSDTYNIVLRLPGRSVFLIGPGKLPLIDETFDLRDTGLATSITDAFRALLRSENRVIRVVGKSLKDEPVVVEVMLDEEPLRAAMIDVSFRILGISIVLSMITATLVFFSLQWLLVRPMRRITASMVRFKDEPEDETRVITPGARSDEIGVAERELHAMQKDLRAALSQRRRLAALGSAVAKINHDLRNSLATAMLVSDRLAESDDPDVKRVLPRLFNAMDRAVNLCSQTLNFASQDLPELALSCFSLSELIDDVAHSMPAATGNAAHGVNGVTWRNQIASDILLEADREQLFRAIGNISQNAVQAGATEVSFRAERNRDRVCIEVADNAGGLPEKARQNLFTPFLATTKKGGTGLGLVIARDVLRAHGGDLQLSRSGQDGTIFTLDLPEKTPAGARYWY